MATNDFLVFGGGSSPNVIDQATYAALAARLGGFQSGTALSAQLNKVWRQSSIMAAVLAQFTANFSGQNSVDDGTIATLLANLQSAINAAGITAPQFDSSTKLATTAFVQQANGNFQARQVVYGATSITNAASGSWIECAGVGGYTITLPNPSATNLSLTFSNVSNGVVTLATPSANIYDQGNSATTLQIDQNAVVKLASDGNWVVICNYSPTPKATTAAQFDNSTKLATTAFTQRALGNYRSARGYVGNATLSAIDVGAMITWDGNGTLTLPDATAFPGGSAIRVFKYAGPIASVLAANKTGQMNVPTSGADTYTFPVGVFGFFELINESSIKWDVAGELFSQFGTTAAAGDNSSRIATTAFVKQAGESYSSIQGIATTSSLNGGHVGAFIWAYGAGITLTLPPVAGVPNGATITIGTPIGMTVKGNASESINNQFGVTANTLGLNAGEQAQFVSNGGAWYLSSYTTVLGTTPAAGDNSTRLATTSFANGVGGVVGTTRNAQMSVASASASAAFTADEIVVETALGGAPIRLANFNKTINLAATGAGGMDTGSAPASGYVALYAIYNPTTGTSALLATNCTGSVASSVYSAGSMPAGYTASSLVSVWPTNGSGQFIKALQRDRRLDFQRTTAATSTSQVPEFAAVSVSSIIPKNAVSCSGWLQVTCQASSSSQPAFNAATSVASDSTGLGDQQFATANASTNIYTYVSMFRDVPVLTAQTLYWASTIGGGTFNSGSFMISGYSF
ncbi:hypothetical protein QZM35_12235 [Burkholderia sp. AU45274]|uniref:hypothetical protein n=1 Tax=Burkholderia sp. AU45274 TaxID=3059205 RepID=UPI0026520C4E|nr:hypothetical protein [Burkholderia sp. AU45274]MDN7488467.1 hypothetical protein [Burkholderia sp. AU45274]